jgi:aspartyl-tRNA synthetase
MKEASEAHARLRSIARAHDRVIPFPKTASAVDVMVDAPTPVSSQQLRELRIEVKAKKEGAGD